MDARTLAVKKRRTDSACDAVGITALRPIAITRQIAEAGRVCQFDVPDHVVIGRDDARPFVSLRESGLVAFSGCRGPARVHLAWANSCRVFERAS